MRDLHASQIKAAVEAVKARKEVNEVYFVACGGSQAVLMAGQYMFDKEKNPICIGVMAIWQAPS